jgi:hypothetical protein
VAGVQHPCPPLTANVERIDTTPNGGSVVQPCISATANLAQTVLNGVSLTVPTAPQTEIWFLLYAQLRRADGEAWRNLLLAKLPGLLPQLNDVGGAGLPQQGQSIPVTAVFAQSAIDDILHALRLPANAPLSVLAVELFGKESEVIGDAYYGAEVTGLPAGQSMGLSASLLASGLAAQEAQLAAPNSTGAAVQQEDLVIDDPLGEQLGAQRILRVSPLTPVRAVC